MASFFKKALGVFVEFDETQENNNKNPEEKQYVQNITPKNNTNNNLPNNSNPSITLNEADIEKFEKHFDKLFDQANLPGPDYYEFWKMSETLEAHIHDEKARFSATFASLSIQGLTKAKLLEAAEQYKQIILKDKAAFEGAIDKKAESDLETRKSAVVGLEKKIVENAELIKKLTAEITDAQNKIGVLKEEIKVEEQKLSSNKNGYNIACEAMLNKITLDMQKIQAIL
jgi:hypothetical protein